MAIEKAGQDSIRSAFRYWGPFRLPDSAASSVMSRFPLRVRENYTPRTCPTYTSRLIYSRVAYFKSTDVFTSLRLFDLERDVDACGGELPAQVAVAIHKKPNLFFRIFYDEMNSPQHKNKKADQDPLPGRPFSLQILRLLSACGRS